MNYPWCTSSGGLVGELSVLAKFADFAHFRRKSSQSNGLHAETPTIFLPRFSRTRKCILALISGHKRPKALHLQVVIFRSSSQLKSRTDWGRIKHSCESISSAFATEYQPGYPAAHRAQFVSHCRRAHPDDHVDSLARLNRQCTMHVLSAVKNSKSWFVVTLRTFCLL